MTEGTCDCCDIDPDTHPRSETFITKPDACGNWDGNCNGIVSRDHACQQAHLYADCGESVIDENSGCRGGDGTWLQGCL